MRGVPHSVPQCVPQSNLEKSYDLSGSMGCAHFGGWSRSLRHHKRRNAVSSSLLRLSADTAAVARSRTVEFGPDVAPRRCVAAPIRPAGLHPALRSPGTTSLNDPAGRWTARGSRIWRRVEPWGLASSRIGTPPTASEAVQRAGLRITSSRACPAETSR